tara:strand:- start:1694 stop:1942 length:249 start_codon:yes stop_codon:yes gene_type:complete
MVKVEGTLDELREIFGSAQRARRAASTTVKETQKAVKKTRRTLSKWQRYVANRTNHIKFKRGPKKGRLDLKAMSKAFKRSMK